MYTVREAPERIPVLYDNDSIPFLQLLSHIQAIDAFFHLGDLMW